MSCGRVTGVFRWDIGHSLLIREGPFVAHAMVKLGNPMYDLNAWDTSDQRDSYKTSMRDINK